MAQTGYTPILLYSSSTTTNAPAVGNLTNSTLGSELAINITDGKLFYKDNANAIQVIGWKVRPANAGGTGITSYAVGDLLYADTTSTLAKLADVATGNALISGGVNVAPSWGKIGLTTHVSGTLPTANGGTNLTSFTPNGVLYASSSSVLATSSNFTWDSGTGDLTLGTGNLVIGTSGKGIDFSATPGTGTSELLADYEEGTYTAVLTPQTSGTIPLNSNFDTLAYTKVGRLVTITGQIQTFNPSTPVGSYFTLNLPFTIADLTELAGRGGFILNYQSTSVPVNWEEGVAFIYINKNASTVLNAENLFLSFSYFAA